MNKISLVLALVFGLVCSVVNAAQIEISNPNSSAYTRVTLDQPYAQFTKVGTNLGNLQQMQFDEFWSSTQSFWITDLNGMGSYHTVDFSLQPDYVVVRPSYLPEGNFQEFGYEYVKGLTRWSGPTVNLPYGMATNIPEPSSLALAGIASLFFFRRKH
jgi:hypothetical protein